MEMFSVKVFDELDPEVLAKDIQDFVREHCKSADTEFKCQYSTYVMSTDVHYTAVVEVWENMQ